MDRRSPLRHRVLVPFALAVVQTVTLTDAVQHLRDWFSEAGAKGPVPLENFALAPKAAGCRVCRRLRRAHARPASSRDLEPEKRVDRQGWVDNAERNKKRARRRWFIAEYATDGSVDGADGADGAQVGQVRRPDPTAVVRYIEQRSTSSSSSPASGSRVRLPRLALESLDGGVAVADDAGWPRRPADKPKPALSFARSWESRS
ncbi:hypothetical protein B0T16DRAFT_457974 [Cercophora newfieldiana]|uniref:Uncharacterized protein n=1 Tax=Cercophora newfieldiana TaxID=92897 RepID=A0AA39Y5X5_9PEZI|nr:hypothetical protein B0T16DRAFT_457974 [Cercophora newfieldiana]